VNIEGQAAFIGYTNNSSVLRSGSGAFEMGTYSDGMVIPTESSTVAKYKTLKLNASLSVTIGPDVAPAHLSKRLWRRVS
jgi:hypothetical protein